MKKYIKKPNWIVILTRVDARIFSDGDFQLIKRLQNRLGRVHNKALTSSRPGLNRSRFSRDSLYYSATGEKDVHAQNAIVFSTRVARYLEHEMNLNRFKNLTIVAEPRMKGYLRKKLNKNLVEKVQWESKDLGRQSIHQIKASLGLD